MTGIDLEKMKDANRHVFSWQTIQNIYSDTAQQQLTFIMKGKTR